jgi:membrane-associated HD superfamily phosphohydrolase
MIIDVKKNRTNSKDPFQGITNETCDHLYCVFISCYHYPMSWSVFLFRFLILHACFFFLYHYIFQKQKKVRIKKVHLLWTCVFFIYIYRFLLFFFCPSYFDQTQRIGYMLYHGITNRCSNMTLMTTFKQAILIQYIHYA